MANTFTNLIATFYKNLDIVARELTGLTPSVDRNSNADTVGKNQTLRIPVTLAASASDVTPAMTPPTPSDIAPTYVDITISKVRKSNFHFTGEEYKALANGGIAEGIKSDSMQQAIRVLANEIETDLATDASVKASRAYGTAGTTPFASSLAEVAQMAKILKDNGAPKADPFNLVVDTSAGANLLSNTTLNQANTAGTDQTLRKGILLPITNFNLKESSGIVEHTAGAGSGYVTNLGATLPVGSTEIIIDTGTGTVLAGDAVTFAGDTNKYIVTTGVAAPGTITISEPGLRQTLADGVAMTIGGTHTANLAFSKGAILLATRTPAIEGEDIARDSIIIRDPNTGLAFRVAEYAGYHQSAFELSIAWGYQVIKPEFLAILLG